MTCGAMRATQLTYFILEQKEEKLIFWGWNWQWVELERERRETPHSLYDLRRSSGRNPSS